MLTCHFEDGHPVLLRHVTCGVIFTDDNKVLLVKRSGKYSEPYKWALPGGFVDRDENLFQAVIRECLEETGYEIHNPSLFLITHKPDRRNEDRQNIDFIFSTNSGNKVGESDHEIETIKWYKIPDIPKPEDMAFDHGLVLHRYIEYLKNPSNLPILDFEY